MSLARNRPASNGADEIATVRIELRGSDPVIWRQLEVPISITLKGLHDIVQAAMGWCDYHLWEFTLGSADTGCRWTRIGAPSRAATPARFAYARC
jgi:hypothetical protein